MVWFDEIATSRKDFDTLMGCLFADRRLPDLGFEEDLFCLLKTSVYHRPMILQYERKVVDRALFVAKGFVFAFFYNQDQEIVPFRIFRQGSVSINLISTKKAFSCKMFFFLILHILISMRGFL